MTSFKAVRVTDTVYWVGAIDWSIRNFHGYSTNRGTSYNAFLVLGEKKVLIDTVKAPFQNEMLARINSIVDPGSIDYIISNHSELDHSGCLPSVIQLIQPEKVITSKLGVKTLLEHFPQLGELEAVSDGEKLNLGNKSMTFYETKMLHWPESMITFLSDDDILFSQDAFGMHLASTERFDDEIDNTILKQEAAKYFANILLPFSQRVEKILERLDEIQLPIKYLATDHGPIWRSNIKTVLDYYSTWSARRPSMKALVCYDTMWQSTKTMAHAVTDGLLAGGAQPKVVPIGETHRSDIATEFLDASGLVVGSPTLNNNILPTVADMLTYMKGLKPTNVIGAAFGSFGWSGEAVKQLNEYMTSMKISVVSDGVKVKYVPDETDLHQCHELGKIVALEMQRQCHENEKG